MRCWHSGAWTLGFRTSVRTRWFRWEVGSGTNFQTRPAWDWNRTADQARVVWGVNGSAYMTYGAFGVCSYSVFNYMFFHVLCFACLQSVPESDDFKGVEGDMGKGVRLWKNVLLLSADVKSTQDWTSINFHIISSSIIACCAEFQQSRSTGCDPWR